MFAWLLWRLDRLERLHAVARAIISEFGPGAYAEVHRREREAQSDSRARDWRRVAAIVARRMSRPAGFDAAAELPLLSFDSAGEAAPVAPDSRSRS
jgi:hypothetical protein